MCSSILIATTENDFDHFVWLVIYINAVSETDNVSSALHLYVNTEPIDNFQTQRISKEAPMFEPQTKSYGVTSQMKTLSSSLLSYV